MAVLIFITLYVQDVKECKTKLWTSSAIFAMNPHKKMFLQLSHMYISNTYIQWGQFAQKHAKFGFGR